MCEMLGYELAEIMGLDVLDTYLPADREEGRQRVGFRCRPVLSMRFERFAPPQRRMEPPSAPR